MAPAMKLPTFRDVEGQIGKLVREQGGIGAVVVDMVSLGRVERGFGESAYHALHAHIETLMAELRGSVRDGDIITRDERHGDRYVVFLGRRRDPSLPFNSADLRRLAERVESQIGPRVARLILPYLREKSAVDVGYGFVLHNPVESLDRQVRRLLDDCLASGELRRHLRERDEREALVEIIYNRKMWTAFQPIVEMKTVKPMGYEGLSRGPRGSELESAGALFGAAHRHDEGDELERACRRQIFKDWEAFGTPGRLFINTVPATVRDPSFLGRGVLDYLGPSVSPQMVTLEITEKHMIENLNLYREAMHSFLDMGFSFAIDDVGAGYSGLETMANLGATYFKIDMGLVRDVHQKRVSQQVVKAILDMGTGVGALVIAEGIETAEEAEALQALGVRYAQGYFFGRPQDPYASLPQHAARASS
jgi:EAL domain-containing protein (putative c-di-GMP-specific phosphodiesterase class I)